MPAPFQRTIILPPDPPPTYLARQIGFPVEEQDYIVSEGDEVVILNEGGSNTIIPEDGVTQINPDIDEGEEP